MGKMASDAPGTHMGFCGFAWPAAGVPVSLQMCGPSARPEARGPCASSLRGSSSL